MPVCVNDRKRRKLSSPRTISSSMRKANMGLCGLPRSLLNRGRADFCSNSVTFAKHRRHIQCTFALWLSWGKGAKISHPNKNLSWPAGWSCRKCTEINSWTYLNEMFKPNKYGFSKAFLLTLYFLLLRSPLKWQCISLSQRVLQPKAGYQMGLGDRRWENSNPATSHPKVLNLSASPRPSPVGKDMGKCWRRRRKTI